MEYVWKSNKSLVRSSGGSCFRRADRLAVRLLVSLRRETSIGAIATMCTQFKGFPLAGEFSVNYPLAGEFSVN